MYLPETYLKHKVFSLKPIFLHVLKECLLALIFPNYFNIALRCIRKFFGRRLNIEQKYICLIATNDSDFCVNFIRM